MSKFKRIGAGNLAIINTIGNSAKPLTPDEVIEALKDQLPDLRKGSIYQLCNQGYLKSAVDKASGYKVYSLDKEGKEAFQHPEKFQVMQPLRKASKKLPSTIPAPEQAILPLNVSHNTNTLMDNISSVIQENAHYRDLLLSSCRTLAAALGMRLVPMKQDQNQDNE